MQLLKRNDRSRNSEMLIEKDVQIPTRNGDALFCDVYRPKTGKAPAILSAGAYGKDMHMGDADPWEYRLCEERGPHMRYERFHAESWVADGYCLVHIDVGGSGSSPGILDPWSVKDADQYEDAIAWVAAQEWCTGGVAMCGLSYHSCSQPPVAQRRPPALKCMIMWEVGHDYYRHLTHPGGVYLGNFVKWWWRLWCLRAQHGVDKLTPEQLADNRVDYEADMREHSLIDDYWNSRIADVSKINVPFLTVANWCGVPLSLGSHFEMFDKAASEHKWLKVISGKHVKPMYDAENRLVQKKFLDYWLKNIDNGLLDEPRVNLTIRHQNNQSVQRAEDEWPLARTRWTDFYLNADNLTLSTNEPTQAATTGYHNEGDEGLWLPSGTYDQYLDNLERETKRDGSSVTFVSEPFDQETEITGPLNLKVNVSVEGTDDTDVFVTLRSFSPDGYEVVFDGILDNPNLPVSSGILRASHRALAPDTLFHSPKHLHTKEDLLKPGKIYELEIPVGPTSVVIEKGGWIALEIGSRNGFNTFCYLYNDQDTRKMGGSVTVHTGPDTPSKLVTPVIPSAH